MADYVLDFLNIFTGLRKTIVMLLTMAVGTTLIVKGYLSGNNYVDLMKTVIIGFFGANSVEHFSSMVKSHLDSKSAVLNNPIAKKVESVIVAGEEG